MASKIRSINMPRGPTILFHKRLIPYKWMAIQKSSVSLNTLMPWITQRRSVKWRNVCAAFISIQWRQALELHFSQLISCNDPDCCSPKRCPEYFDWYKSNMNLLLHPDLLLTKNVVLCKHQSELSPLTINLTLQTVVLFSNHFSQ